MAVVLDKVNNVPMRWEDFPSYFTQWLANTVDTMNEVIQDLQEFIDALPATPYTSTQITDLFTAGSLPDGVLLYDTTLNEYVGQISGALVKFTTTPYP